jgi:hypothetical protein
MLASNSLEAKEAAGTDCVFEDIHGGLQHVSPSRQLSCRLHAAAVILL